MEGACPLVLCAESLARETHPIRHSAFIIPHLLQSGLAQGGTVALERYQIFEGNSLSVYL